MCSVLVATTILEVLKEKIQNEDVFTAFDVTQKARNSTDDNVIHRDVKSIITNEFVTGQMPTYNKDYRTLSISGSPFAVVYYPDGKTADDHALVGGSTPNDDSTEDDSTEDGVIDMTAEGRINVPKNILDKVDAVGGSYDFILQGIVYPMTPNKDGRVRFSMKNVGMSGSKVKITADLDNNTINIETV